VTHERFFIHTLGRLALAALVTIGALACSQEPASPRADAGADVSTHAGHEQLWTCGMHPDVIEQQPHEDHHDPAREHPEPAPPPHQAGQRRSGIEQDHGNGTTGSPGGLIGCEAQGPTACQLRPVRDPQAPPGPQRDHRVALRVELEPGRVGADHAPEHQAVELDSRVQPRDEIGFRPRRGSERPDFPHGPLAQNESPAS